MSVKILNILKIKDNFSVLEVYVSFVLFLFIVGTLSFYSDLTSPLTLLVNCIGLLFLMLVISYTLTLFDKNKWINLIRRFYVAPIIFFIYTNIQAFIRVIHSRDYDNIFIEWDYAIFGVNPTEWIMNLENPLLTEYLQFCYFLFYLIPMILAIDLVLKNKKTELYIFSRAIVFSFLLSYLLYLLMPAIGPRFTVHSFASLNLELPGLWLSEYFREFINTGGGIIVPNIDPALQVNRDCMPSGHTWVTLVVMIFGFKFSSRLKWLLFVMGTSLIFSTVYLRYHYVVDILVGVVFALFSIWIEPKIRNSLATHSFKRI